MMTSKTSAEEPKTNNRLFIVTQQSYTTRLIISHYLVWTPDDVKAIEAIQSTLKITPNRFHWDCMEVTDKRLKLGIKMTSALTSKRRIIEITPNE